MLSMCRATRIINCKFVNFKVHMLKSDFTIIKYYTGSRTKKSLMGMSTKLHLYYTHEKKKKIIVRKNILVKQFGFFKLGTSLGIYMFRCIYMYSMYAHILHRYNLQNITYLSMQKEIFLWQIM